MACLVNTNTVYMHLCLQNAKSKNVITPFVLLIEGKALFFGWRVEVKAILNNSRLIYFFKKKKKKNSKKCKTARTGRLGFGEKR